MNDSSASKAFAGVTFSGVRELVRAIQRSTLRSEQQIKKVFSREADGWEPALAFCLGVGFVRSRGDILTLGTDIPDAQDSQFPEYMLSRLLFTSNRYRGDVLKYLAKFEFQTGEIAYASPVSRRAQERSCRNFLMELGVVSYRSKQAEYVVSDRYLWVYAVARDNMRIASPNAIAKKLCERNKLGDAAENCVLEYERTRVGPELAREVKHVAPVYPAAGYDIRSVTVGEGSIREPRYIEVKAVSTYSPCFYWSRNEVEVAKILGPLYYLYLVPVRTRGDFDLAGIMVISNPRSSVLGDGSEWVVECDGLKCCLNTKKEMVREDA